MDQNVTAAIGAVSVPDNQVDNWCAAICSAYARVDGEGNAGDWTTLSAALTTDLTAAGFTTETQSFTDHLDDDSAPADTVAAMAALGATGLAAAYRTPADPVPAPAAASDAQDTYDPQAWEKFLAQNGPRWNGTDDAWAQFTTWFRYEADQAGVTAAASGFLDWVGAQADKIAAFGQYGVQINAPAAVPDTSSYPTLTVGDEGDWVAYLDTMLQSKGF